MTTKNDALVIDKKLMRCMTMLKLLPRLPKRTGTRKLKDELKKQGIDVSQRTIQRDLRELQGLFPGLRCDDNPDVAGWCWDSKVIYGLPAMDAFTAFAFRLMDAFMGRMLPQALLEDLSPYRDAARRVLDSLPSKNGLFAWENKVRIISPTQPLLPAPIKDEAMRAVYQALFEDCRFRGRYRRRDGDEAEYEFNPLGLVFQERVVYLVATLWEYDDPRQFALHRFFDAQLLNNKPARTVPGFSLEDYVRSGAFEYVDDLKNNFMPLKARFCEGAVSHLRETPLAENQTIKSCPNETGWYIVEATVRDSMMLRWWLLGFGDGVEVLEPASLRSELGNIARNMAAHYAEVK
jgi:predicted DNA-binding transcriptional regulator YafY